MALTPGQTIALTGDVTRLNWVEARAPALVEKALGYQAGRLSSGYLVALLIETLRPNHVEFGGLTLRSGGRDGLPEANPVQDWLRPRVHDRMVQEYGGQHVNKLLDRLAKDPRNLSGAERIVKILPVIRHQGDNPAQEYPAGGGAPQYKLIEPHNFLIAAEVSPDAIAKTGAGWSVSVAEAAAYDGRAKLARYLQSASATS